MSEENYPGEVYGWEQVRQNQYPPIKNFLDLSLRFQRFSNTLTAIIDQFLTEMHNFKTIKKLIDSKFSSYYTVEDLRG